MLKTEQSLLLVEDNLGDADLFQRLIQQTDNQSNVTHASTLTEAITACREKGFDAVLLDLNLPDSNGVDTTSNFCSLFQNLPVVVLTGLSEEKTARVAISQGAQDYLVKDDLTAEVLGKTIGYAIERQKVRGSFSKHNDGLDEELQLQLQLHQIGIRFISSTVEELKGPVNLISACAESLKIARNESDPLRRNRLLFNIEQSIEVVFEFLDALQGAAREKNFTASCCQPSDIQLGDFCQAVITKVANNSIKTVPINLKGDALSRTVSLDPLLLSYILQNLLDNAVKYSPSQDCVDLKVEQDGDFVNISVCDRGIGIPLAEQSQVTRPFYRGLSAREQPSPGSGLGLSIVQSCVELHQGRIELESSQGNGTIVKVWLPLNYYSQKL